MGGAEVWRIAGSSYPVGTPKKGSAEWSSEWFYIDDVTLPDPVRRGLPEFSSAPLKKLYNWRPNPPPRRQRGGDELGKQDQDIDPFRTLHSGSYGYHDTEMHPATSIPSNSPMELQRGGRRIPLQAKESG